MLPQRSRIFFLGWRVLRKLTKMKRNVRNKERKDKCVIIKTDGKTDRQSDRRTTGRMAVDRETHFFRLVGATHTEHFFLNFSSP